MLDQFPAQNAAAALREPATSMVRKGRLIGTTRAAEKPLDAFWPSAAPNPSRPGRSGAGWNRPRQGRSGPQRALALARMKGSFAQRYVKRHAPVRERAETRRLHWFLSPDFKAVFGGGRRRNPEPFVGHVALQGQVDVFPKPWNWERRDMGRLSGGNPEKHVPQLCSEIGVPV
jgi:hypothetical protein